METGDKNRDDFHFMQMSLVMIMRFIFGDDLNDLCKLNTFAGNEVIFPERSHWFSCNYVRVLKSKYPESDE